MFSQLPPKTTLYMCSFFNNQEDLERFSQACKPNNLKQNLASFIQANNLLPTVSFLQWAAPICGEVISFEFIEKMMLMSYVLLDKFIEYDGDGFNVDGKCLSEDNGIYRLCHITYYAIDKEPMLALFLLPVVIMSFKQDDPILHDRLLDLMQSYFALVTHFLSSKTIDVTTALKTLSVDNAQNKVEDYFDILLNGISRTGAERLAKIILEKNQTLLTPEILAMALHNAIISLQPDIVKKFIRYGAAMNKVQRLYQFDGENYYHMPSPLSAALKTTQEMVKKAEDKIKADEAMIAGKEIVKLFLEHGADPDLPEKNIKSARHYCLNTDVSGNKQLQEIFDMIIAHKPLNTIHDSPYIDNSSYSPRRFG